MKDIDNYNLRKLFTDRFISHTTTNDTDTSVFIMEWRGTSFARMYWYKDDDTTIYLGYLSVDNCFRGNGIGTELQEIREEIGRKLGATTSCLWVKKDSWMHDWYIRRGYKDTDKEEQNGIWMKKSLKRTQNKKYIKIHSKGTLPRLSV